jgi:hypothetical protein
MIQLFIDYATISAIAVQARKISREEKESQEELTISLVYPKSKKAKPSKCLLL